MDLVGIYLFRAHYITVVGYLAGHVLIALTNPSFFEAVTRKEKGQ
jgi:hypothetical protein